MRIWLTGFGPFPGAPANPTADLVPALAARCRSAHPDADIRDTVLAVEYGAGLARIDAGHARLKPDIALHFGLSGQASEIRLERRAVNACADDMADAAGFFPQETILDGTQPPVRVCDWPGDPVAALRSAGFRAAYSDDAGRYLCNAALMRSLACAARRPGAFAGFVHVPHSTQSAAAASADRRNNGTPMAAADLLAGAALVVDLLVAQRTVTPKPPGGASRDRRRYQAPATISARCCGSILPPHTRMPRRSPGAGR